MKKLTLYTTIMSFFSVAAYAGSWTQEKGKWQLIASGRVYDAGHYFDNSGKRITQPHYHKQELGIYGEYGWRDDVTLGIQSSIAHVFQDGVAPATQQSNWNLSDSEIFARKRVWQSQSSVVSLQPFVVIPSPEHFSSRPKVGSNHYSSGLAVNYGYGFQAFGHHHYLDLSANYTYRFAEPKDQLHAAATLGWELSPNWTVMPQLFAVQRVKSPEHPTFTESSADDYNLTTTQLSLLYSFSPKMRIQMGVYDHFSGKNTGAGRGVQLSWWRMF